MNQKLLISALLILALSAFISAQDLPENYFQQNREVYFSFEIENKTRLSELTKIISIDNVEDNVVYAYANENEFNDFLALNISYKTLKRPGIVDYVKMSSDVESLREWDSYPTYEAYVSMMYQFETDYPGLCEIVDAGETVEGRKIFFAKISDNIGQREAEPQVMYSSTMHGDETTGYVLMLRLIDYLLSNYGTNAEATALVDDLEIWINPDANPDGTYNSGNHTVNGATRSNANGYDLNRNFPDPKGGSNPTGPWQPETIIMMNLAQSENFVLSANFHGGTEVVNYPWDTWPREHADNDWFVSVSRQYADTVHAFSPASYMSGYDNGITNGYAWYEVEGGRQDYYTYFNGGREITLEVSDVKLLSASQLPAHWTYNFRSLMNYLNHARYGIKGIVTDNNGETVEAKITILNHDIDNAFVYSDAETGFYTRMIMPGTYDVMFEAGDYFSKTITGVQVAPNSATELNVELISQFGDQDTIPPAIITDLSVIEQTSNSLKIQWSVPLDESAGGVTSYDIRYSTAPITEENFEAATQTQFPGQPAAYGETEALTITGLNFATTYYFAVKSSDIWGNTSGISAIAQETTYDAPVINVTPASMAHTVNVNTTFKDTLVIKNNSGTTSTLDYSVEIDDKKLAEKISLSIRPVEARQAKGSEETEGTGSLRGSGGPDLFGYEWIDSDAPNGPQFEWNDISSTGTLASDWTPTGTFSAKDEGYAGPFDIGFNFDFYGEEQTQVYVYSNGFLGFSTFSGNLYSNSSIPSSSDPNGIIAPFWDDLDGKTDGQVYYKQESGKFIIQYKNWHKYSGSGSLNFQVVLNSNGKIEILYDSMTDAVNSATVGIENAQGNDGLQVVKDAAYIHDGLALEFSSQPEWILMEPLAGTLYNGAEVEMIINFTTVDLPVGIYNTNIKVTSNDPVSPEVNVPVTLNVGNSGLITMNINYNEGWNLVSVPVHAEDMSVGSIFPGASSQAFMYNNGYAPADPFTEGFGYWLKFGEQGSVQASGTQVSRAVELNAGWNIVGIYNTPVQTSQVVTQPAGIISSSFFGYGNGYNVASQLEPGKGYWVKTTQAGQMTFTGAAKAESVSLPEKQVVFTDADGRRGVLYLYEGSSENNYEMPPLPPAGGFDVRFADNRFAAEVNAVSTVSLSGVTFPVSLKSAGCDLNITYGGQKAILKKGEELRITNNITEMFISGITAPTKFALSQNYPNPFNPSTVISYSLPEKSDVSLKIYDMLGSEVATLVNEIKDPGSYEVKFDGSQLSSGVYIYVMRAGKFNSVRKLVLMK